jgi:hypothetical protein
MAVAMFPDVHEPEIASGSPPEPPKDTRRLAAPQSDTFVLTVTTNEEVSDEDIANIAAEVFYFLRKPWNVRSVRGSRS